MSKQFWETGNKFEGEEKAIANLPKIYVLVDGDIVAYRCAAAADGRYYEVDGQRFKYSKDAKAYCDKAGLLNAEITSDYDPEPVENALHSVAVTLENIENHYIHNKKMQPVIKIFTTGKENFRKEIFPDYKKSRVGVRKPFHLQPCKDHLQEQFGAFLFEGYEADDLISMFTHRVVTTASALDNLLVSICSCDKDFTQNGGPGVEQYDFTTGKTWEVTEWQAIHYFYKQILMGDKSDDIIGLDRVGSQTAIKILKDCKEERDLYNTVVLAYKDKRKLSEEEAIAAVNLNGKLLHLCRSENDRWTPPKPRK